MNLFNTSLYREILVAGLISTLMAACNFEERRGPGLTSPQTSGDVQASAYSRLVSELFTPSCVGCHDSGRPADGVDLTAFATIVGGKTTAGDPVLVPGEPANSIIYKVIADGRMPPPPKESVTPSLLAALGCWIERGAPETGASDCFPAADALAINPTPTPTFAPKPTQAPTPTPTPAPTPKPTPTPSGTTPPTTTPASPTPPASPTATPTDEPPPPDTPSITFAEVLEAVLEPSCLQCHSEDFASGDVDLSAYDVIMASSATYDGEEGPLVVPGSPELSMLWRVVEDGWMPMQGPIPAEEQSLLRQWIQEGAHQ